MLRLNGYLFKGKSKLFTLFLWLLPLFIFNYLGCSTTHVNKRSLNEKPDGIYFNNYRISMPNGYTNVREDEVPEHVKNFAKELRKYFPIATYNNNSGILIFFGSQKELDNSTTLKFIAIVKDLKDQNKLQKLLNKYVFKKHKWLKISEAKVTDFTHIYALTAKIEATFMETSFLICLPQDEGAQFSKYDGLVALTFFRPELSDVAIKDILTIFE